MALAIGTQCLGSLSTVFVGNGLLLLYLLALDFEESLALALTSGIQVVNFSGIFFAQWAEKKGLKWVGALGLALYAIGISAMGIVYLVSEEWRLSLMLFGIVVFAVGKPAYASIWFPLLRGVVPESLRGRFFGVLRFSWQGVGLCFLAICSLLVGDEGNPKIYAFILAGVALVQFLRIFVFLMIPSTEEREDETQVLKLWETIKYAIHWPGFASFCAYVFLMSFATGVTGTSFALSEKTTLSLPDSTVVGLGNLSLLGTILGALLGGMIIDRYGTKIVFLVGHLGIGMLMFLYVARGGVPIPTLWVLGICHGLTGLLVSSVMLGVTTEMYSIEPDKGRTVSFALISSCTMFGSSLSGVLGAALIELGVFGAEWKFLGAQMGPYDGLLLILSGLVMMLVVTLCLVPSVLKVKPHKFIPQG